MSSDEEFAFFAGMAANNVELQTINPDHAERVRNFYRDQGRALAADRVKAQICFDALEDDDHRCTHHAGKCYELWQLYIELKGLKK